MSPKPRIKAIEVQILKTKVLITPLLKIINHKDLVQITITRNSQQKIITQMITELVLKISHCSQKR